MDDVEELRIEADSPTPGVARSGARVLEDGGILVHPTSTVYGLGSGSEEGEAEVERLKDRPGGRPLLRIAYDLEILRGERPGLVWTPEAGRLAREFWPGPLTLVLEDGSDEGLGVRVEAHPITRAVLRVWGRTLSSTSLNRSGEPPATTPSKVRSALARFREPRVPIRWLDAGDLPGGPPSTVLSLRKGRPRLLRRGAVGRGALERTLGCAVEVAGG